RTLFTFPKPVVAAVNGHAIAGGCVMVLACDARLMAEGAGTIGMPELLVGVPFPADVLEVVRFAVPRHKVQSLIYTGRTLPPQLGCVSRLFFHRWLCWNLCPDLRWADCASTSQQRKIACK